MMQNVNMLNHIKDRWAEIARALEAQPVHSEFHTMVAKDMVELSGIMADMCLKMSEIDQRTTGLMRLWG